VFIVCLFCFIPFSSVSAYYSQIDKKTGKEVVVFDMNDVFKKLEAIDEKMATKEDLKELREDMRGIESSLREDMRGIESGLSEDMRGIESSLREDIRNIWNMLIGLIATIVVASLSVKFIFQKEIKEIATDISKKESRIACSDFHHHGNKA